MTPDGCSKRTRLPQMMGMPVQPSKEREPDQRAHIVDVGSPWVDVSQRCGLSPIAAFACPNTLRWTLESATARICGAGNAYWQGKPRECETKQIVRGSRWMQLPGTTRFAKLAVMGRMQWTVCGAIRPSLTAAMSTP